MKITIQHRETGDILYEHLAWDNNVKTPYDALAAAVKSGADLRGANLRNMDFRAAKKTEDIPIILDLDGVDLRGVDFSESNLENITFFNCNLEGADFSAAHLIGANFLEAKMRNTNFTCSILSDASFVECDLTGAIIIDADMSGTKAHLVNFDKAIMDESDLSDIQFSTCSFIDVRMNNVSCSAGKIKNSNLSGAHLSRTFLCNIDFHETNLNGAVFDEIGTLVGAHPVIKIDLFGHEDKRLFGFTTDNGVYLMMGRFFVKGKDLETSGFIESIEDKNKKTVKAAIKLIQTNVEKT